MWSIFQVLYYVSWTRQPTFCCIKSKARSSITPFAKWRHISGGRIGQFLETCCEYRQLNTVDATVVPAVATEMAWIQGCSVFVRTHLDLWWFFSSYPLLNQNDDAYLTRRLFICQITTVLIYRFKRDELTDWKQSCRFHPNDTSMDLFTTLSIHTSRPRQNDRHFAHDIFLNECVWISSKISLNFVP